MLDQAGDTAQTAPATRVARPSALRAAAFTGLGVALPEGVVGNAPIAERLGLADGWIERRTGIERRRHAGPEDGTATLGAAAALAALADAGLTAADVDLVIAATCTADHAIPGTAPEIAHLMGTDKVPAYDLGAACSGFVMGLDTASALIESGRADTIVLVGVEVLSRFLDPDDKGTAPIFGDGAGAAVLTAAPAGSAGIDLAVLGSDGGCAEFIVAPRGGTLTMDGHATFGAAISRMSQGALDACAAVGITLDDIDLFVFHQANARILASVADRLSLDPEKVVNAIGEIGNVSAASIPVALDHARSQGRLHAGDRILCGAFGAGLTWGSCVLTYGAAAGQAVPA
ncbi:beta-ketoacyl-ACP synthase 3 [Paraconexibacter antarcticus]|uniref:Beta-ketoacyl-ACP synthase 3 n=1 Tax=Paraconexibacter antarcticus TaxID=2949664 RepID=A0ABY5DRT3_9ACTN|nr:beta-ketoacyl-ACP synthase 3 [Paraconexibacter antarcticus]UTI63527.1 beta-ketoacyl-ACP synthase 3 [Paraconexibacter antarcticus]